MACRFRSPAISTCRSRTPSVSLLEAAARNDSSSVTGAALAVGARRRKPRRSAGIGRRSSDGANRKSSASSRLLPYPKDRLRFCNTAFDSLHEVRAIIQIEHNALGALTALADTLGAHLYRLCRPQGPGSEKPAVRHARIQCQDSY